MTRTKRTVLLLSLLAGGAYCAGHALWNLGKTAMYVHESVVVPARVVDMEKRPFESMFEAMEHGNLPWEGDTAYRPFVSCTLPAEPVAIPIPRLAVKDLDNRDYTTGQEVDIILPLADPEQVHLNRFKFLWGGDCLVLLLGLLLGTAGYLPLRKKRARRQAPAKQQAAPKPQAPAPEPEPAPKRKSSKPKAKQVEEEPFQLESTPAEPPKKKRIRKPKDPNAPAKPRKPRKKKGE